MEINIKLNIDDRIINFFKRTFRKRNFKIGLAVFVIGSSLIVYAAVTKPFNFSSGSTISSSEVNQNFDTVYNAVNTRGTLQDSTGQVLGYILDIDFFMNSGSLLLDNVTLLSTNGYIYQITWDGNFYDTEWNTAMDWYIYVSGGTCSPLTGGTYYKTVTAGAGGITKIIFGKTIFYQKGIDKIFVPKDIALNGTANIIPAATATAYTTYVDYMGTCPGAAANINDDHIEIIEISKTDAGIPTNIVPPLSIVQ